MFDVKCSRKVVRKLFITFGSFSSREVGTGSFPENLCRDPGNFFYISKDFSGTDFYHSEIKNALLQVFETCFASYKLFFKIRKILQDEMLVRSKFFLQFVKKIEKLKLNLLKPHIAYNKMLKSRSKMLKTRGKNGKIIKLGKNFGEFPESRGFSGNFLKITRFPGS